MSYKKRFNGTKEKKRVSAFVLALAFAVITSLFFLFQAFFVSAFEVEGPEYTIRGLISEKAPITGDDYKLILYRAINSDDYNLFVSHLRKGESPKKRCIDAGGSWLPTATRNKCCGDDLPSFQHDTMGDLGFITPKDDSNLEGFYACFDNAFNHPEELDDQDVSEPGNNYSWRAADNHAGIFMLAHENMFISNIDTWFYCNAMGVDYFDENFSVEEGKTFPASDKFTNPQCLYTLGTLGFFTTLEECEAEHAPEQCQSFLELTEGDFPAVVCYDENHDLGASHEFREQCGEHCFVKPSENDDWMTLEEFFLEVQDFDDFLQFYCEKFSYDVRICEGLIDGDDQDLVNQDDCANPENCLNEAFDTTDTCKEIHEDVLGYNYPDNDNMKFCDTQIEYCKNGYLFNSSDSAEKGGQCCIGQNAFCAPYEDICADIGGNTFNVDHEICIGDVIGENCCLGTVTLSPEEILSEYVSNQSYMCYKDTGRSFFKECCGALGCFNEKTELYPSNGVLHNYVMDGVALHSLLNYDDASAGRFLLRVTNHQVLEEYDGGSINLNNNLVFTLKGYDFSNFDYAHFDFATNKKERLGEFIFVDVNYNEWAFNLSDLFTADNMRWQHVVLDLNEGIKDDDFDETKVARVEFSFKGDEGKTISFLFDNLFLRAESSDNLQKNTKPMFCSGNWGTWIENLDGPTDEGWFYGDLPELSKYGPYKDACNGVISYAWTGTVCCGDDTLPGNKGEFWIDKKGMCWNGTPILHDNTLANALSSNYREQEQNKKGLLFFSEEPILCEASPDEFDDINFIFDGEDEKEEDFESRLEDAEKVEPFTIRGNWICQEDEGWVKLEDLNRVTLIASFLINQAIKKEYYESFNLHCADKNQAINYFDDNLGDVGSFCILRTGSNRNFIRTSPGETGVGGKTYAAFESKDILFPLEKNLEEIFTIYPFLDDHNFDCSEVTSNPEADEFFSKCSSDENDFNLYYNRPLNIFLISDDTVQTSFISEIWDNFVNFFRRLFGNTEDTVPFTLLNFTEYKHTEELYISKQGERSIIGKVEHISTQTIRIDYHNLTTNVSFLAEMMKAKHPNANMLWVPQGNTQIIYSEIVGGGIRFNELTSQLRLRSIDAAATWFEPEESCTIKDSSEVEREIFSKQTSRMYAENEPIQEYCSNFEVEIECLNGELYIEGELQESQNGIYNFYEQENNNEGNGFQDSGDGFEVLGNGFQDLGNGFQQELPMTEKYYFECQEASHHIKN